MRVLHVEDGVVVRPPRDLLEVEGERGVNRVADERVAGGIDADLLGAIGEYPRIVASAAELREPHRVARYLEELAGVYHRFYDNCRVLPRADEELGPEHLARLWLCAATRQTIANGLDLLGVSAPERM